MHYFLLMIGAMCFALTAQAKTMAFESAMGQGLAHSPFAAELSKTTAGEFGADLDESNLENPEMEYEYRPHNSRGELQLTQPFRPSDITLSRYKYKQMLSTLNSMEKQLDLLRLYHHLYGGYYELYVLQEQEKIIKERQSFLSKAQKSIHGSVNQGGLSVAEALAFEADVSATGQLLKTTQEKRRRLQIDFAEKLSESDTQITVQSPPKIVLSASKEALFAEAVKKPSYHKMLMLNYTRAKEQLSLIKQDRYLPTIGPRVGYDIRPEERSDNWKVGVVLSIPLWNQKSGQYKAAKENERYYRDKVSAVDKVSFRQMVDTAYDTLKAHIEALNAYQKTSIPLYRKSISQAEQAFLSGQISILDVWQMREKYNEAYQNYLDEMIQSMNAKIELETLIGFRLEDL